MSTRKIKNAVNNTTGELIYFKGHAKATFMSDGSTVEDTINNIESKIDLSDYVKSEELEGYAKREDIPSLEGYAKSDEIPSLDGYAKTEDIPSLDGYAKTEDIPSLDDYASKEWVNNRNYATEYDLKTIDYSTINNVPLSEDETGELNITDESGNIGMKVASEAVYAKDFVAGEHKLSEKVDKDEVSQKQDVISDLETIRQGAAKGATALQSYTEQYKGTVTGVKINGTTKSQSNGIVDLGTVITAHQTLKTINGQSIVGSGNITISGGGSSDANVQAVDTGDVLDDVNVDYATKTYVDGLVGDINSVLESIISGYSVAKIITFRLDDTEYQAEEGMTFGQWMLSDYYVLGTFMNDTSYINSLKINPSFDSSLYNGGGIHYNPEITTQSVIIANTIYITDMAGGLN